MSNLRDIMQMFRERDEAIKRLTTSIFSLETTDDVERATVCAVALSELNARLDAALDGDLERAKKFFALCKRTHWTAKGGATDAADMLATSSLLLRQSAARAGFRPDLRCERHRVAAPRVSQPSRQLSTAYASLDDIGMMMNPQADRFVLCRVLSVPVVSVGVQFVAEDALRNAFWVQVGHAPATGTLAARAMLSDAVGALVAIHAPVLSLSADGWQPVIKCPHDANFVRIRDRSSDVLRATPWFEAPLATPLEWKVRGNERFAAQRYAEACAAYSRGLELDPEFLDLRANRTTAWIKLGEWTNAIADADGVLQRDKTHRKCAMRRASALAKSARFDEAAKAWAHARTLCAADAANDLAECAAGEARALLSIEQRAGRFNWRAVMATMNEEVGTYVHASVTRHKAPRGMVASAAIKRGELVLVETALAATLWQRDLNDALLAAALQDAAKREQLATLCRDRLPVTGDAADSSTVDNAERVATSFALDFWPTHAWRQRNELRAWRGVGVNAAYLQHSCRPNCVVTTVGELIVVQTIDAIAAGDELTVARCRIDAPLGERRAALEQQALPQCRCERCTAEASDNACESLMRRFYALQHKVETGVADLGPVEALVIELLVNPLARDNTLSYLMSMCLARQRTDMQAVRKLVLQAHSASNRVDLATCTLMLSEMESAYSAEKLAEWIGLIVPSEKIINL
jgi:tetratricopeptide (TPR) repeat protein